MLNRIVFAIKVLNAFNFISSNEYLNECNQPKDPSEVVTVMEWDWDTEEGAAAAASPSGFLGFNLGFNVDDLYTFVVDAVDASQSFVVTAVTAVEAAAQSMGPWLLPLLSLFVGMFYLLGFRPFERLNRLSSAWRCAATMLILVASFLEVWTFREMSHQRSVHIGTLSMPKQFEILFVQIMTSAASLVARVVFVMLWACGRGILYAARSCLPMTWSSWLCVAERVWDVLTFPILLKLRLLWWAKRNVLALVWMAVVAVCSAIVAGATGAAKGVRTICGSFKGMVQLSAVRVYDLVVSVVAPVPAAAGEEVATVLLSDAVQAAPTVSVVAPVPAAAGEESTVLLSDAVQAAPTASVVAPVPAAAGEEAMVLLLPVAVQAAPAVVETEAVMQVEESTANATVASEVAVDARAKSKVPKDLARPKPRRRTRPAPESKVEPRRSRRIADKAGR
jgi:hypothetical protein